MVMIKRPQLNKQSLRDAKNRPEYSVRFPCSFQLINTDDFFLIIRAACLAYSVRHHQGAAFAALNQCRSTHFPVCSSLISSCFGRFILRTNRHRYTSLFALKISLIAAILGSGTNLSHPHSPSFKLCPQTGQIPLQSSLHKTLTGILIQISLFMRASVSNSYPDTKFCSSSNDASFDISFDAASSLSGDKT